MAGISRIKIFCAALAGVTAFAGPAYAQSPEHAEHHFRNAAKWARIFDDPARDDWQQPVAVIRALAPAADAAVADIGSGTGYFSVRLARALPRGQVYGVDTEHDMVQYLAERARREGLRNITAIAGTGDDTRLPVPVDLAMLVDVYHHIADRGQYFRRLRGALKPGGRVAIIDFRADSPEGPPPEARIAPDRVKAEMARAGYVLAAEHTFLPRQYFLIFRPAARN